MLYAPLDCSGQLRPVLLHSVKRRVDSPCYDLTIDRYMYPAQVNSTRSCPVSHDTRQQWQSQYLPRSCRDERAKASTITQGRSTDGVAKLRQTARMLVWSLGRASACVVCLLNLRDQQHLQYVPLRIMTVAAIRWNGHTVRQDILVV